MRMSWTMQRMWACSLVTALGLGVAGCGGGGGGGDDTGTVARIDITSANRDSVSHASAASMLAFSPASGLATMSGAAGSDSRAALSVGFSQLPAWAGRVLGAMRQPSDVARALDGGSRMRPLAVTGPIEEACMVSGSVAVTFDDRDNNLAPSAGDGLTIQFKQCRDSESETVDGLAVVTYTAVSPPPTLSLSARMTLTELSNAAVGHALKLNGSMLLDFVQTGPTTAVSKLTADGAVVATVTTHEFSDTVTLHSGFREEASHDSVAGRTTSTISGSLESVAAGGIVDVSSVAGVPIVNDDVEDYPTAGAVRVRGRTGTLLMTALPTQAVRLELDANDDGSAESSETVSWDWLL